MFIFSLFSLSISIESDNELKIQKFMNPDDIDSVAVKEKSCLSSVENSFLNSERYHDSIILFFRHDASPHIEKNDFPISWN